jgi:hypothetical protein
MLWFSLQLYSERFLILRRNERDTIKSVNWSSCKVPVILVILKRSLNLLETMSKRFKYFISWKSDHREPSCSMWRHGRTDMTKIIIAFRNFAKAPKNQPGNDAYGKCCLFRESKETYKCTLWVKFKVSNVGMYKCSRNLGAISKL